MLARALAGMEFGANFPEERPSINHKESERDGELITARILLRVQREDCHCRERRRHGGGKERELDGGVERGGGGWRGRRYRSGISKQPDVEATTTIRVIHVALRASSSPRRTRFHPIGPPTNRKTFSLFMKYPFRRPLFISFISLSLIRFKAYFKHFV